MGSRGRSPVADPSAQRCRPGPITARAGSVSRREALAAELVVASDTLSPMTSPSLRPGSPHSIHGRRSRIELFGGVRVRVGVLPVSSFRTQRAAWLLARLALHDRVHSRDELVEMFWPGASLRAGRQSLSQALSELRRHLGTRALSADLDRVRLEPAECTSDVRDFARSIEQARRTHGPTRRRWLARAAHLARAPLLPGVDLPWVVLAREHFAVECDVALRELAEHHARAGDLALAFDCACRRLRLDPLGEDAHREVARFYRRVGRTAAALEHLRRAEQDVESALGLAVEAETRALAASLREELHRLRVELRPSRPA